jgi:hypothetical protein
MDGVTLGETPVGLGELSGLVVLSVPGVPNVFVPGVPKVPGALNEPGEPNAPGDVNVLPAVCAIAGAATSMLTATVATRKLYQCMLAS